MSIVERFREIRFRAAISGSFGALNSLERGDAFNLSLVHCELPAASSLYVVFLRALLLLLPVKKGQLLSPRSLWSPTLSIHGHYGTTTITPAAPIHTLTVNQPTNNSLDPLQQLTYSYIIRRIVTHIKRAAQTTLHKGLFIPKLSQSNVRPLQRLLLAQPHPAQIVAHPPFTSLLLASNSAAGRTLNSTCLELRNCLAKLFGYPP